MIEGAIEPPGPTAVGVDWMRNTNVERVLDDPPDLLGFAS
jgi:hypothetical protein